LWILLRSTSDKKSRSYATTVNSSGKIENKEKEVKDKDSNKDELSSKFFRNSKSLHWLKTQYFQTDNSGQSSTSGPQERKSWTDFDLLFKTFLQRNEANAKEKSDIKSEGKNCKLPTDVIIQERESQSSESSGSSIEEETDELFAIPETERST